MENQHDSNINMLVSNINGLWRHQDLTKMSITPFNIFTVGGSYPHSLFSCCTGTYLGGKLNITICFVLRAGNGVSYGAFMPYGGNSRLIGISAHPWVHALDPRSRR